MYRSLLQQHRTRIALAASVIGAACVLSVSLRPAPARAENTGTVQSGIAGPVRLMRGQTARIAAFVPAALRGDPKRLDLKFAISMGMTWTVVGQTFLVDKDCPWEALELQVTLNGDVVFEQTTIGHLPAGVVSIDVAGHEMSHGVTGNAPATACALEVRDTDTGET